MNLLLLAIAILPVILIGTFIHGKDKNKEPIGLLALLFFSGVLSCFLVIFVSRILTPIFPFMQIEINDPNNTFLDVFLYSFVGVALVEEICKFSMVYAIGYRHKAFDEVYDIVVYSIFVALGFAGFENILYVLPGGLGVGIARGLLAVPGHACDGLFMGYYISLAKIAAVKKDAEEERNNILKSIVVPTVLHGIYDFCCFYGNAYIIILFVVFIIAMYVVALKKLNHVAKNNQNILNKQKRPIEVLQSPEEINVISESAVTEVAKISNGVPTPTKNKSEYFTITPEQPRPNLDAKSDNFKFEDQGVPYIPDLTSSQNIDYAPIISKEQNAEYVPPTVEEHAIPETKENPIQQQAPVPNNYCVYCGAKLKGEYCSVCGHKAI